MGSPALAVLGSPAQVVVGFTALTRLVIAVAAIATLLGEGGAEAQRLGLRSNPPPNLVTGKHCLGDQEQKLILEHYLVGAINPLGLENQLRLSVCTPFVEKPGLLFDFTNFEFGVANYISPTHVHGGIFGALTPLSFLTLRAEVTAFYIWPLGSVFPGAGVIPLANQDTCAASYDDIYPPTDPSSSAPPNPTASNGYGVRTLLGAALQGAVPLGKRLDLLLFNGFNAEYWRYNTDQCVFVARRDVGIRGSGSWILANTSVLAFSIKVHPNHTIRVGASNDLVYTPGNEYLGNIAAGLIAYGVNNLRNLAKSFALFIRVGTFTHGFRKDGPFPQNHANPPQAPGAITLAAGLDITYELAKRPTRRMAAMIEQNQPVQQSPNEAAPSEGAPPAASAPGGAGGPATDPAAGPPPAANTNPPSTGDAR